MSDTLTLADIRAQMREAAPSRTQKGRFAEGTSGNPRGERDPMKRVLRQFTAKNGPEVLQTLMDHRFNHPAAAIALAKLMVGGPAADDLPPAPTTAAECDAAEERLLSDLAAGKIDAGQCVELRGWIAQHRARLASKAKPAAPTVSDPH